VSTIQRLTSAVPFQYILKRLASTVLLMWGVFTLVFILVELAPGTPMDKFIDPQMSEEFRDNLIKRFGYDKPVHMRYLLLLKNLLMFDLGGTLNGRLVSDLILAHLPNTLLLSGAALLVTYPLAIVLGTIQATRQGKLDDTVASLSALFFYSMPTFWLALMLQLFAAEFGLPTAGMVDAVMYDYMSPTDQTIDILKHLVLPTFAMGIAGAAGIARYMRSSLLEVIRQDFVRTARAKGLPERVVVVKHALRNALLPIITLMGMALPRLVGGSVLVETVFAWPGMGQLIIQAINQQDIALLQGCFLLFALVVALGNLLADIGYALADPRIRFE
jgi:peptide/nickel transport system permease protein